MFSTFYTCKLPVPCPLHTRQKWTVSSTKRSGYTAEILHHDGDLVPQPLDSLRQILIDQRIIATHALKRGEQPTVSFSQVPLQELLSRRKFQSHLHRWDWEPYGIAIRANTLLEQFSAEPVVYFAHQEQVRDIPQWRIQPATSSDGKQNWADEQEWRTPVDIRLGTIQTSDAFVFVRNWHEAKSLANISRFQSLSLTNLW